MEMVSARSLTWTYTFWHSHGSISPFRLRRRRRTARSAARGEQRRRDADRGRRAAAGALRRSPGDLHRVARSGTRGAGHFRGASRLQSRCHGHALAMEARPRGRAGQPMRGITGRFVLLIGTAAVGPLVIYGLISVGSLRTGNRRTSWRATSASPRRSPNTSPCTCGTTCGFCVPSVPIWAPAGSSVGSRIGSSRTTSSISLNFVRFPCSIRTASLVVTSSDRKSQSRRCPKQRVARWCGHRGGSRSTTTCCPPRRFRFDWGGPARRWGGSSEELSARRAVADGRPCSRRQAEATRYRRRRRAS